MSRRTRVLAIAVLTAAVAGCGGHRSAKPSAGAAPGPGPRGSVTPSADSGAPAHAPAHWLPPEAWIYNHWLPFDETRLHALLQITRRDLWEQLRDDHRTLAQLAARRGWPDPKRLAAALVPAGPRAPELRGRAVRVTTQGHLAQHLFFHSLHQFAIPSEAPELFGVS